MARQAPGTTAETLTIESRRTRVAEAYLCGHRTVRSIARYVNSSPATVTRDLHVIRQEWKAAMVQQFAEARADEIARLDRIEREAWAEWERSKTVRERSKTSKRSKAAAGKGRQPADAESTAELTRENLLGDARYLERIGWCIDRRIKLLGLDAPERHEHSGPAGRPIEIRTADQFSDDELAAIAAGNEVLHE